MTPLAMNDRALLSLSVLLLAAGGPDAGRWLSRSADRLRAAQSRDPMTALVTAALSGAALFYAAERGKNPKVTSFQDALAYVSTNLSVGSSGISPSTRLGKLVHTILTTWGPSLALRAFDPPRSAAPADLASDAAVREVAEKLDAILQELRSRGV